MACWNVRTEGVLLGSRAFDWVSEAAEVVIAEAVILLERRRREGRRERSFEKRVVGLRRARGKLGPCHFRAERALGNASIATTRIRLEHPPTVCEKRAREGERYRWFCTRGSRIGSRCYPNSVGRSDCKQEKFVQGPPQASQWALWGPAQLIRLSFQPSTYHWKRVFNIHRILQPKSNRNLDLTLVLINNRN